MKCPRKKILRPRQHDASQPHQSEATPGRYPRNEVRTGLQRCTSTRVFGTLSLPNTSDTYPDGRAGEVPEEKDPAPASTTRAVCTIAEHSKGGTRGTKSPLGYRGVHQRAYSTCFRSKIQATPTQTGVLVKCPRKKILRPRQHDACRTNAKQPQGGTRGKKSPLGYRGAHQRAYSARFRSKLQATPTQAGVLVKCLRIQIPPARRPCARKRSIPRATLTERRRALPLFFVVFLGEVDCDVVHYLQGEDMLVGCFLELLDFCFRVNRMYVHPQQKKCKHILTHKADIARI